MKNFFFLTIMLMFAYTFMTFAQLDSVYYQGPLQGSVPGGAIQNTDSFTDEVITGGDPRVIPLPKMDYSEHNPILFDYDETLLPPSVYIEDSPTMRVGDAANGQAVILQSFLGIPMTNSIPPDPTMAVGPNHIVTCANSVIRIFDKQGNILKIISAGGWWAPVSPFESGDPQVIYDHLMGRWVIVWMEVNDNPPAYGSLIAYSDDDNPLGVWYIYRLPHTSFPDYPKLGFDDEALYIMTRNANYNYIRIINKTEFYASNGGPVTYNDLYNIRTPGGGPTSATLDCITPAISYTPGSGAWFFWAEGNIGPAQASNFYVLYKITNPLTNPGVKGKVLAVPTYVTPPVAQQLGGGQGLETIGWMSRAPVVRDGFLYAAHDIRNSTNSAYSSVKYLKVDLSTPSIVENIEFGNIGYYYLYPAITVDKDHNVAITFTRSATTEYAGAYFSTKLAGELTINPSLPIAEGQGNYVVTFGSGRNRWGDYFGIYLDPVTERNVWMLTEFAAATNTWGTQVGEILIAPYPGAHAYPLPASYDFGDIETGTTSQPTSMILANFGDSDLNISDIPASSGDFNLETTLSFPIPIATYDSLTLEFSFSPSSEGLISEVYPVTSNDPQFAGIELSGTGYDVVLATEKTFYASSGLQNNGEILTIDPVTGVGTNIGPSSFNEVSSLSINPLDGKIYGLVTGSGSSDIVKINAVEGDAHLYYTLDISLMAAIAFDTTGTLYGITRTGDLYTIDINTGTSTFIVDAVGSYLGITFHPQTNELWATSRAIVGANVDAIFTVNLTTGDTTIVGHTGLGKQTNDIVFDENLNLFGVIGTSSQVNDFVSINTSNGTGTIVGSVGLNHILGLTYIDEAVTSVEGGENNSNIPSDYALRQNYPNPFNPNTKINFALPVASDVKLVIYNILGQEVITLVDEQKSAGNHTVIWNARDAGGTQLTSGIYLYKLTASGTSGKEFQDIKKMILLK